MSKGFPGWEWIGQTASVESVRRLLVVLLLIAGLVPSAWLAWQWRAMPQLGIYHDDAIYLVSAKSLAEGSGYRIDSLPERPPQTKYPPLWPALLAGVWKLAPEYPANLPWMALLVWSFVPVCAWLCWTLFRQEGFGDSTAAILAAIVCTVPSTVMVSTLLLSELPFLALLLATLIAVSRGSALAGGLLGGAAFLARSAALPLAIAVPVWFAARREWRKAAMFAGAMLPAVAGWQWWTYANRGAIAEDPLTLFYTSYLGYWKLDLAGAGLPALVYANSGALLNAIGHLIAFDASGDFLPSLLARALGAAAISGSIRLARQGRFRVYAAFAALYCIQLLCWNYPPVARFVLPLLPLAAAGAWAEFESLAGMIETTWKRNKPGDRVAAALIGSAVAVLVVGAVSGNATAVFRLLPESYRQHQEIARKNQPALEWLRDQTPEGARVLSYGDPSVYLMTGRRGYSLRVPPGIQKRGDRAEVERYFRQIPDLVRAHGIGFAFLALTDYHLDSQELTWPSYRDQVQRTFREGLLTASGGAYVVAAPGTP